MKKDHGDKVDVNEKCSKPEYIWWGVLCFYIVLLLMILPFLGEQYADASPTESKEIRDDRRTTQNPRDEDETIPGVSAESASHDHFPG